MADLVSFISGALSGALAGGAEEASGSALSEQPGTISFGEVPDSGKSYPRTVVQLGGQETGGQVTIPVKSWDVSLSQSGRPGEATITTSISALNFDIVGATEFGFNASLSTKGFPTTQPLSNSTQPDAMLAQVMPIQIWVGYIPEDQIQAFDQANSTAGAQTGSPSGLVLLFDGVVETTVQRLRGDELELKARDRSILLQETRINTVFENMTPDKIAALLASQVGLTCVADSTDNSGAPLKTWGYLYKSKSTSLKRGVRAWDVLLSMAKRIGFDVFVIGKELHFEKQKTSINLPTLSLAWGTNVEELEIEHNPFHAKDFQVKVYGYDPKGAVSVTSTVTVVGNNLQSQTTVTPSGIYTTAAAAVSGAGASSAVQDSLVGKPVYMYQLKSGKIDKSTVSAYAMDIAVQIARRELHVTLSTVGIPSIIDSRIQVNVRIPSNVLPGMQNTSAQLFASGKALYPTRIDHRFDVHGTGYTTHIVATTLPPNIMGGADSLTNQLGLNVPALPTIPVIA